MGAAPYVSPGRKGGRKPIAPVAPPRADTAAEKRAKAATARAEKAEAEIKRLKGGNSQAKIKPPTDTDEVKALRKKLAAYKAVLEEAPDDTSAANTIMVLEVQIENASPKDQVQTSVLQAQLEDLEKQITKDEKAITDKFEFAKKKEDELQKFCLKVGTAILEKGEKVKELKKLLAVRATTILPPIETPPPSTPNESTIIPTFETAHLPDFIAAKMSEITLLSSWMEKQAVPVDNQPTAKKLIEGFQTWSEYGKLLCIGQAEISAALDIANGRSSTNMAPEKPAGVEGSPERTQNQNDDKNDANTNAPTVPALPIPEPISDADAKRPVPDDGDLDMDEMEIHAGKNSSVEKSPWYGQARSLKGVLAMASISRAESALQVKKEIAEEK